MPRNLSELTVLIYWWLWRLPWASAADIARVTGLEQPAVANTLRRGVKRGWFREERLSRAFQEVNRFVLTNAGVDALHQRYGWRIFWWHTANGVVALERRLEIVEMAYAYLPLFWQSNLVRQPTCYVYRETEVLSDRTGERVTRIELEETDWRAGALYNFHWMETPPFEAIATYENGKEEDGLLHLPVMWRGFFQKPRDIAELRSDMEKGLIEDRRWSSLPQRQAVYGGYWPGAIVFTPDRVSAAMVQRHWMESRASSQDYGVTLAIIDAQGQVVRAMNHPPAAWWESFLLPSAARDLQQEVGTAVDALGRGACAAANGHKAWSVFRAVDGSPAVTLEQIAEAAGMDTTETRGLLASMRESGVIAVQAGGHYLDSSGRGLLAYSQRRTPGRVLRRWGVYANRNGQYTRQQRLHNQGQMDAILALRRHGFPAFPAMGLVIDYWVHQRLIRVAPDGAVVLPPGVLAFLEFEQTARTPQALLQKAEKYKALADLGVPVVVLFITNTASSRNVSQEEARKRAETAALHLARLDIPYLLSTTLDTVKEGPHGAAVFQGGNLVEGAYSGCWWVRYSDRDAPDFETPIDLWTHLYVQRVPAEKQVWRVPMDNPWMLLRDPWWW